jgi:hypothetical protein
MSGPTSQAQSEFFARIDKSRERKTWLKTNSSNRLGLRQLTRRLDVTLNSKHELTKSLRNNSRQQPFRLCLRARRRFGSTWVKMRPAWATT